MSIDTLNSSSMSFTDLLLQKYATTLAKATHHNLTNELCQGTLPDWKLFTYLVQDLKYFELGLNLMGNALARCTCPASAVALGKQIGFLANNENTYFHTCLSQLRETSHSDLQSRVRHMLESVPPVLPEVQKYLETLAYLVHSQSYEEIITLIYVMEKVYLGWAEYNLAKEDSVILTLPYKHKEWVDLHSGPEFSEWVKFLGREIDRVARSNELKHKIDHMFKLVVELEIDFFDGCYRYGCET